jgi:4-amino-4-deoxy-L-arabinose transferase-like glycosyltransferase
VRLLDQSNVSRFTFLLPKAPPMPPTYAIRNTQYAILLVYLALATLFATTTPAWQNPDEPAHYNYVAYIAIEGRLPVLQMGDYDEAYLQRLKDEKFPAELSVAPVRYEFHQPPLYYLLAAPVYWLSGGSLLALRLFSALLGAGAIWLLSLCFQTVFPTKPGVVLAATAFVAFLPMHLAILSSLNNDSLAELLIAGGLLVLLRWMAADGRRLTADRIPHSAFHIPHLLLLGVIIGLGFLTKATAYILLPVALFTIAFVTTIRSFTIHNSQFTIHYLFISVRRSLSFLLPVLLSSFLFGLLLWLRNIATYGGLDFLGLHWHDRVVTGQPTTVDWIAANGWSAYWERAGEFTFKSFWGVFGWLGVFMDGRIYTLLLIFSGIVAVGLLAGLWRGWTADGGRQTAAIRDNPLNPRSIGIFVALLLLAGVAATYVWYNLGFVQHQGRYLFPALFSFGLLVALGWREALRPRVSFVVAGLLLLWAVTLGGMGLSAGALDKWTLLFLAGAMGVLLINGLLERIPGGTRLRPFLYALPFVVLLLLDAAIPFLYTMPQLTH